MVVQCTLKRVFFVSLLIITSNISIASELNLSLLKINNLIKDCWTIKQYNIEENKKESFMKANIYLKKSAGYCGCKSAELSYYVKYYGVNEKGAIGTIQQYSSLLSGLNFSFKIDCSNNKCLREFELFIQCSSGEYYLTN